jgi:hypothetical protein
MRTRSRADDSCSALRMVERVFALSTTEPTGLFLRRTELDDNEGEGLPAGPIGLPELRSLLLSRRCRRRPGFGVAVLMRARGDAPGVAGGGGGDMALPGCAARSGSGWLVHGGMMTWSPPWWRASSPSWVGWM